MKRLSIIVAAGLAAALAVNAARAAVDMAGWKTYRNDADGHEFKYPSSLSLSIPSGSVCTNDDCKPFEEVTLRRYTPADGSIRMLQFTIQRGINPQFGDPISSFSMPCSRDSVPELSAEFTAYVPEIVCL